MRLGTSRTLSRRAKLRRVRGASTAATWATPRIERYRAGRAHEVRPAKIAQQADAPWVGDRLSRTPSGRTTYVARSPALDGCGYRPVAAQCSGDYGAPPPLRRLTRRGLRRYWATNRSSRAVTLPAQSHA